MVQTDREYRVLVRLDDGRRRVSAAARERRRRLQWSRRDGALLLEPAERERPAALAVCLARAYARALCRWRDGAQQTEAGFAAGKAAKAC